MYHHCRKKQLQQIKFRFIVKIIVVWRFMNYSDKKHFSPQLHFRKGNKTLSPTHSVPFLSGRRLPCVFVSLALSVFIFLLLSLGKIVNAFFPGLVSASSSESTPLSPPSPRTTTLMPLLSSISSSTTGDRTHPCQTVVVERLTTELWGRQAAPQGPQPPLHEGSPAPRQQPTCCCGTTYDNTDRRAPDAKHVQLILYTSRGWCSVAGRVIQSRPNEWREVEWIELSRKRGNHRLQSVNHSTAFLPLSVLPQGPLHFHDNINNSQSEYFV